ncbi:uncharacterized protein LOC100842719 [Brachypodium distachyon]|uniref:F-box protein AT5G49610-like beta-propeller domain-containing protein n=1 Tax=Brachypodium distachyon TaxID=15368 RepID=A0A2K2DV01_BRADI|nr:uncharacterized protein LOC100842719 [Brachypodium distachyon]PNT78111.1 hypothetical protein BRADI_1g73748v3 [Brachypodium distachyon]|eukprot:XP_010230255.2 uncharacterized protein LOC100842719 [Brachypodium distachyon]
MAFVSGLPYEVEVKVWTSIFVSTASFCPPARRKRRHWHVLDSRHGLVLFYTPKTRHDFLVCDLVTCKRWWINASPKCKDIMSADLDDHDEDENRTWNAMMFCAKEGCGHLDCHGLPFQVVFVGSYDKEGIILASVYSSETGEWSGTNSIAQPETIDKRGHSALVGNNVYFPCEERNRIVNYDMAEQELSVIDAPSEYQSDIVLMGAEDGMLLFTTVQNSKLCLLSMEAGPNRAEGWARSRVIELKPLLPLRALREDISVVGFAEGVGVIFLRTVAGLFKIELTAGRSKKVHEGTSFDKVMPYTRFYTGERGAAPIEKLHAHLFGATTV